jgi:hypothetical protein
VLIRSGEAIQTLKDIKVVVLDKTGTITEGKPALTEVVAAEGFDETTVLRAAASVEAGSEHPLGQAVVGGTRERGIDVPAVGRHDISTARIQRHGALERRPDPRPMGVPRLPELRGLPADRRTPCSSLRLPAVDDPVGLPADAPVHASGSRARWSRTR